MFKQYFNKTLPLIMLGASLVACGSGSITDRIVDAVLTTDQKQLIAKQIVRVTNPLELVDAITGITTLIGFLPTGPLACTSGSGSGNVTTIDTPPVGSFGEGDSIVLDASNCQTVLGTIDGKLSITGTNTGTTTEFSNTKLDGSSLVNGRIDLSPSNNYNLLDGTGTLGIKATNLAITENGETATLKNGDYIFALSGNSYTFTADQAFSFSQFPGKLTAKTEGNGFSGSTNLDASGDLNISSPLAGEMIITYPGGSKATVSANTGNETTYALTVDNQTINQLWDQ